MKEPPAAPPQDRPETPPAPVDNRVFVLVLQHPQEGREPRATAGLILATLRHARLAAGLSWPNLAGALGRPADPRRWGALYLGSARPRALAAEREILVLDRAGRPLAEPAAILAGLTGIVLLDGSWKEAKTLWWRNPWLLRLHRLVLNPPRPARLGRLRREPRREALSTLEAAALALRHLEAGPQAADALEAALDRLIAAARRPGRGDRR
jgi:tRNA-uridine aminocarboxypropyltransferase